MGDREGDDGEGGNGVRQMGRGAMGRGQQEGGDREVGKREGEKKGHEEGGISQMDRNAWVDIWNAWVERDYRVFLLCLPVQRRVPQLVYIYGWSLAIDGWRIRPLKYWRGLLQVQDRYVAHNDWIHNVRTISKMCQDVHLHVFRAKTKNHEKSNAELELFEL